MFDRVLCVSLDRRQDRKDRFTSSLPSDWPWLKPQFFRAISGAKVKHPQWWHQGGGAWGCYRSHCRILEDALMDGLESVLIMEDDATFCDDFPSRAERFFSAIPSDWEMAYLGGQHLKRPNQIFDEYVVCRNVNRTHAYAARGKGIRKLYKWLMNTKEWHNRHHVDHHYGRIVQSGGVRCYAPAQWLCGQAGDERSDVCGKPVHDRWWNMVQPGEEPPPRPFVAVLGLHRSGSSATAMMLHKLGVSMGDRLSGYEAVHGGGGEAVGLARICESAARFPAVGIRNKDAISARLREWIRGRWRRGPQFVGGKYPHLCAMGDILAGICKSRLMVVNCDRPLEDSIESLKRRSRSARGWLAASDEQCESVQSWLWKEKHAFIESLPEDRVLNVNYDELRANPEKVADDMAAFVGIQPDEDEREAAIAHIIREASVQ